MFFIFFFHCLSFAKGQVEELFSAIKKGDLEKAEKIVNSADFNIAGIRHKGDSVLHAALKVKEWSNKSQKMLDILIKSGAGADALDKKERSALNIALGVFDRDTLEAERILIPSSAVKSLLKAGADPNISPFFLTGGASTPAEVGSSLDAIHEMLLSAGAKVMLYYKRDQAEQELLEAILREFKNAKTPEERNMALSKLDSHEWSDPKELEKKVSFEEFKKAFLEDSSKLDIYFNIGVYTQMGLLPIVQFLIDFGVDVNFTKDRRSLVSIAAFEANVSVLEALLSTGRINKEVSYSELSFHSSDEEVMTQLKSLEVLLSYYPDWAKTLSAEKALIKLAYRENYERSHLDTVKILLTAGTNPHVPPSEKMLPFFHVSQKQKDQEILNEKKTAWEKFKESGNRELIDVIQPFACQSTF